MVESAEARLVELAALYLRVMGPVDHDALSYDFATQRFSVRHWDGMDGCWDDIAADVSGDEALTLWAERTNQGTRLVRLAEIDYVRIFPGGTRMVWDGSFGREMFRGEDK